jgi:hypothetical protein
MALEIADSRFQTVKEQAMHIVESFIVGALAGGAAVAFFYRRAAIELEKLKQDLEARARPL